MSSSARARESDEAYGRDNRGEDDDDRRSVTEVEIFEGLIIGVDIQRLRTGAGSAGRDDPDQIEHLERV